MKLTPLCQACIDDVYPSQFRARFTLANSSCASCTVLNGIDFFLSFHSMGGTWPEAPTSGLSATSARYYLGGLSITMCSFTITAIRLEMICQTAVISGVSTPVWTPYLHCIRSSGSPAIVLEFADNAAVYGSPYIRPTDCLAFNKTLGKTGGDASFNALGCNASPLPLGTPTCQLQAVA